MSGTVVFIEEFTTLFWRSILGVQSRLFNDFVKEQIPAALDLPTKATTPVLAWPGWRPAQFRVHRTGLIEASCVPTAKMASFGCQLHSALSAARNSCWGMNSPCARTKPLPKSHRRSPLPNRLSAPGSSKTIWAFTALATLRHTFRGRFALISPVTTARSRLCVASTR